MSLVLLEFEFEVITLNRRGEKIETRRKRAQYFSEDCNSVSLIMVAIPGGTFMMGSPAHEIGRDDFAESPQQQIQIPSFFMGKYPVTQAQWRKISELEPIERELQANPDPPYFQGNSRPVTNISWSDAIEFCNRLSRYTGRTYYLPSEAQWEYACRAGTTTPFYFGETISSRFANYSGDIYAEESECLFREETTEVGSFPPNAFGLYDMHGNVSEWCADIWQDQYNISPKIDNLRPQRGGSWASMAKGCRSASRMPENHTKYCDETFGFRVGIFDFDLCE
jgi:formylglycine-generating enzyme required for sulfatase activity